MEVPALSPEGSALSILYFALLDRADFLFPFLEVPAKFLPFIFALTVRCVTIHKKKLSDANVLFLGHVPQVSAVGFKGI